MNKETIIKIDVANSIAPDGYEFTGEYRAPEEGEPFSYEGIVEFGGKFTDEFPILRKIKSKRWRAKYGADKAYFYISEFLKVEFTWENTLTVDDRRYKIGNYFQTEEEALEVAELLKQTLASYWTKKGFDI